MNEKGLRKKLFEIEIHKSFENECPNDRITIYERGKNSYLIGILIGGDIKKCPLFNSYAGSLFPLAQISTDGLGEVEASQKALQVAILKHYRGGESFEYEIRRVGSNVILDKGKINPSDLE